MTVVCPTCRGVLPLPADFTGTSVRCGNCKVFIVVAPTQPNPTATSRPRAATGGTKAMIVLIWGGVAAMTVGTIALVGWILSQKKQDEIVQLPPTKPAVVPPTKSIETKLTKTKPTPATVVAPPTVKLEPMPISPTPDPTVPPPTPTPPAPAPTTPTAIPPASEIRGIATYLTFDGPLLEEVLVDSVTKHRIGRGAPNGSLVDGIRGKALRIQFTGRDNGGLDITDQHAKLDFRIGQSATLSFWFRIPDPVADSLIVFGMSGKNDTKLIAGLTDKNATAFGFEYSHAVTKTRKEFAKLSGPLKNGAATWNHFAMVRADGKLDAYLNAEKLTGESKLTGDVAEFTLAGFGFSRENRGGTFDLDELAIFQRKLSESELHKLAGVPFPEFPK